MSPLISFITILNQFLSKTLQNGNQNPFIHAIQFQENRYENFQSLTYLHLNWCLIRKCKHWISSIFTTYILRFPKLLLLSLLTIPAADNLIAQAIKSQVLKKILHKCKTHIFHKIPNFFFFIFIIEISGTIGDYKFSHVFIYEKNISICHQICWLNINTLIQ